MGCACLKQRQEASDILPGGLKDCFKGHFGEKLHPDGDFSGYVEKGNVSAQRGFLFRNELGTLKSIPKPQQWLNSLMYWELRRAFLGICAK